MSSPVRPPWLPDSLFAEILQECESPDARLCAVSVEPAVAKGENYSSHLFRAVVRFECAGQPGERRFVVKADLSDSQYADQVEDYGMGDLESSCYLHLLPRFQELLRGVGDDSQLAPRCLRASVHSRPRFLVLEDLQALGYATEDRRRGLDVAQLELVVTKLAKWHAASARLAELEPGVFARHCKRGLTREVKHMHAFFENAVRACAESVATWPGCERYAEQLRRMVATTIDRGCDVYERRPGDFDVLAHMDLWMNNVMFRGAEDALFVDLGGFHGSFALDLNYLLFTSNVAGNGEREWDHLLRVYHAELERLLRALAYEGRIPRLVDLHVQLLQKPHLALTLAIFVIPLRLLEDTREADLGGFIGDEPEKVEFRRRLFSLPRYRDFLEPVLDYCYRKGLLEP